MTISPQLRFKSQSTKCDMTFNMTLYVIGFYYFNSNTQDS